MDGSGIFVIELDQDLLNTIKGFFPGWSFGDSNNNNQQIVSGDDTKNCKKPNKKSGLIKNGFKRNKNGKRVLGKERKMSGGKFYHDPCLMTNLMIFK